MAKIRSERGFRFIKELGGAIRRSTVSFAAAWLVEQAYVRGRVLDYGCGFGFDADHYGWEAFDPYYRQRALEGKFETVVCNHVLNMLTRTSRERAMGEMQGLLSAEGAAFLDCAQEHSRRRKTGVAKTDTELRRADTALHLRRREAGNLSTGAATKFDDVTSELERRLCGH